MSILFYCGSAAFLFARIGWICKRARGGDFGSTCTCTFDGAMGRTVLRTGGLLEIGLAVGFATDQTGVMTGAGGDSGGDIDEAAGTEVARSRVGESTLSGVVSRVAGMVGTMVGVVIGMMVGVIVIGVMR